MSESLHYLWDRWGQFFLPNADQFPTLSAKVLTALSARGRPQITKDKEWQMMCGGTIVITDDETFSYVDMKPCVDPVPNWLHIATGKAPPLRELVAKTPCPNMIVRITGKVFAPTDLIKNYTRRCLVSTPGGPTLIDVESAEKISELAKGLTLKQFDKLRLIAMRDPFSQKGSAQDEMVKAKINPDQGADVLEALVAVDTETAKLTGEMIHANRSA